MASAFGTSAGASTGKTVAARKILSLVTPEERIITIEEAAELRPEQPNAATLIADRDTDARSADVLLASTLRIRSDRIVLGEVRGRQAMTFLKAFNTGHGGSLTTPHAETPQLAVRRLVIDLCKKVFHFVALNAPGAVIQRAKFSRDSLMGFFDAAPKTLIGMEA